MQTDTVPVSLQEWRCSSSCFLSLFTSMPPFLLLLFLFLSFPFLPSPWLLLLRPPTAGCMQPMQDTHRYSQNSLCPTFHRCHEDSSETEDTQHLQDEHGGTGREERLIHSVTSPSIWLPLVDYSLPLFIPPFPSLTHFHHLFFFFLSYRLPPSVYPSLVILMLNSLPLSFYTFIPPLPGFSPLVFSLRMPSSICFISGYKFLLSSSLAFFFIPSQDRDPTCDVWK